MTLRIHSTLTVKPFLAAAIAIITLTSATKDQFTPPEQQQISIETPGLFDRSDAFTVDFAALRPADYSFPLPVGKAKLLKDNTLEIATAKGDAVKAMFGGTVRLSRHIPGHGNVIVVRHANGLETVYARNAQNLAKVGDVVKAGQTIAIVGGKEGRTFCSFAIMVNGGRINPATLLNPESHRLLRQTILCKKAPGHVSLTVTHPDKEQLAQAEAEKRRQQAKEFTENPFADGNKFSINFAELTPGQWCYPLPGAKVISRYGRRGGRMHSGVDLKTKPNDEILAAFDGVVTMSQRYYAYGNYIKIRHANGLETCYSHNSKNLVKKGDVVKAGQVIALTGRTGRASTEHLHFECRVNGQTFDPAKIFDHANQAVKMDRLTFTKRGRSVSIKAEKNYMAKGK
mgnify:CR=1 FL=1